MSNQFSKEFVTKLKWLSKTGYALAVLSMLMIVYLKSIFAIGIFAILVQVLSGLLMIWARIKFGRRSFHVSADPTEGGLITSGPYNYLRHPIYAAVLYFIWAGVLSHLSLLNSLLGLLVTVGLFIRIFAEERLVAERYPEYMEYSKRTKRIIPFVF